MCAVCEFRFNWDRLLFILNMHNEVEFILSRLNKSEKNFVTSKTKTKCVTDYGHVNGNARESQPSRFSFLV